MSIVKYEREGARIWQRTVEILVCGTRVVPKARGPTLISVLNSLAGGEEPANMIFTMVNGAAYGMAYPKFPSKICSITGKSTYMAFVLSNTSSLKRQRLSRVGVLVCLLSG
jgi:hypothetical protein